jgi:hypothetical protein
MAGTQLGFFGEMSAVATASSGWGGPVKLVWPRKVEGSLAVLLRCRTFRFRVPAGLR